MVIEWLQPGFNPVSYSPVSVRADASRDRLSEGFSTGRSDDTPLTDRPSVAVAVAVLSPR